MKGSPGRMLSAPGSVRAADAGEDQFTELPYET